MKALLTILIHWVIVCFFSCQKTHTMLPDIIQAETVDSLVRHEQFIALTPIEKQYQHDKAIAIIKGKKIKSELIISSLFSVIVIILLIVCYRTKSKKDEKDLQLYQSNRILAEHKRLLAEITNSKNALEKDNQEVQIKIKQLLKEKEASLQSIKELELQRESLFVLQDHILERSAVYQAIKLYRNKTHCEKQDKFPIFETAAWDLFLNTMNIACGGLIELLGDKYALKREYLLLACFIYLDIRPCNIHLIYGISLSAVSNQRRAVAEHLNVKTSELDEFIKSVR